MPRFIVERTFPDGSRLPVADEGAAARLSGGRANAGVGVTWVHSYVSENRQTSFCVVDGPDLEAIRVAAIRAGLPVDRVTQVSVVDPYLDPYFYR